MKTFFGWLVVAVIAITPYFLFRAWDKKPEIKTWEHNFHGDYVLDLEPEAVWWDSNDDPSKPKTLKFNINADTVHHLGEDYKITKLEKERSMPSSKFVRIHVNDGTFFDITLKSVRRIAVAHGESHHEDSYAPFPNYFRVN